MAVLLRIASGRDAQHQARQHDRNQTADKAARQQARHIIVGVRSHSCKAGRQRNKKPDKSASSPEKSRIHWAHRGEHIIEKAQQRALH
jgi:hypothetical protein